MGVVREEFVTISIIILATTSKKYGYSEGMGEGITLKGPIGRTQDTL
jgi:hypothetical protein